MGIFRIFPEVLDDLFSKLSNLSPLDAGIGSSLLSDNILITVIYAICLVILREPQPLYTHQI